jgi:hypothetical protein
VLLLLFSIRSRFIVLFGLLIAIMTRLRGMNLIDGSSTRRKGDATSLQPSFLLSQTLQTSDVAATRAAASEHV